MGLTVLRLWFVMPALRMPQVVKAVAFCMMLPLGWSDVPPPPQTPGVKTCVEIGGSCPGISGCESGATQKTYDKPCDSGSTYYQYRRYCRAVCCIASNASVSNSPKAANETQQKFDVS